MDGIGTLIAICIALMLGPPLLFLIIGLSKRNSNVQTSKVFYILAAVWLLVGGGICATILAG